MTLIKISATKWNGNGFGNSSAGWTIKGKTDWHITSRNGDWIAINQMTGQRVAGYTRDILLEKIATVIK
jgi:hypothetical protein